MFGVSLSNSVLLYLFWGALVVENPHGSENLQWIRIVWGWLPYQVSGRVGNLRKSRKFFGGVWTKGVIFCGFGCGVVCVCLKY